MNLFEQPQTNLFDQQEINIEAPADVRKPESVSMEARMAALGTMSVGDGLVTQLQDMTQKYQDQIEKNGDESVRIEAAARQQTAELDSLARISGNSTGFDKDGTIQQGAALASRAALSEDIERRKSYALEQESLNKIQNLAASGDYTQAKLLMNNLEHGDPEDRITAINTKRLIMQREIEKAGIQKDKQGWFFDATDFLVSMVPLQGSLSKSGLVDVEKGLKHWYDGLFAGERLRDEAAGLWNMDNADFAKYVKDELIPRINEKSTLLGYHSKSEELELLSSIGDHTPSALSTNIGNAIDNVGLLPVGKLAKIGSLPKLMVKMGARKEAQNLMAQAAMQMSTEGAEQAAKKTGVTAEQVFQGITPTAVNPDGAISAVGTATDTNTIIERGQRMIEEISSLTATERLQPDELERAMSSLEKQLTAEFKRPVKDVNWSDKKLADGSQTKQVEFMLGKSGKAGGFSEARQAQRYANSLGYGSSGEVIRDESGQYFVKLKRDMPEYGFFTNVLNVKATNHLSRRVLNARMLSDDFLANMAQVAGNKRNKIIKGLSENFQEPFRHLKTEQRETLSQILAVGENEGKWWTDDELNTLVRRTHGRDITDAEKVAYRTAQDINDVEYTLRNDDAYKQKLIKGFQTASFDTGIGQIDNANALVDRDLSRIAGTERVFNVSDRVHYHVGQPAPIERLQQQGYIAVTTENPVKLADGTTIKTFLMKGNDLDIKPLERAQIAYRAGGHRMYSGKYFVKQTVKGAQPDTGQVFLESPNTYIVAETPAEASFWANHMEQARVAYLDGKGPSEIDEIFGGHSGFPDGDEFIRNMETGLYDKKHPFVVKFDREMPDEYIQTGQQVNLADESEDGYSSWLRTTGRMYYSRKGEALKDFEGNLAPTLDPFKTIDKSLSNIANITSFSDYKASSVERWLNTFGKYTNIREVDPSNLTQFAESKFAKGINQKIVQAGEAQREIIQRNIGWKTELDFQQEQYTRNFIEWVGGDDLTGPRSKIAKTVVSWWDNKSPLESLRGMAFDMKLGLFNVAQLPLQIGTAAAAISLSPKLGMQGFAGGVFIRHFLTKAGTDAALDGYIQRGVHGLVGLEAGEFKQMFKSAKQSGFFDIGGTHQLIGQHGPNSVAGGNFLRSDGPVRTAGRFFFNEGEIANRAVAWRIAWGEAAEKFPNSIDKMGAEFQRHVAGRAEQYAFNMSEQSGAWWQRGVLSIPTQFWAYNVRMMEAMVGGEFTRAQRARLMLGQSLLYGSAGLPVVPFISEKLKTANAEKMDPTKSTLDTFVGKLDRGLLDTALYEMTGIDASVGKRYGTGEFLTETTKTFLPTAIKDILGISSNFGDKSAGDVFAGATGSIMGETAKNLVDVLKYAAAESGADIDEIPMTREALLKTASGISTVGNGLKAYMVFKYGTILTNRGTTVAAGLPPQQAFASALSFSPGQQDQLSTLMAHRLERKESVEQAARVIQNYRTRMLNEPDNRQEIMQQINIFTKLLPTDIRKDALRKAHQTTSKSLYDGLARQMEKERVQQQMIQEAESGIPN